MRRFFLFLCIISFCSFQQSDTPQFRGGKKAMDKFISENLVYPVYSKHNCIQGTIMVTFQLTKQGKVSGARVSSGMHIDLDDEALRVIRLTSGKWLIPSNFSEETNISIPVSFKISDNACALVPREKIREAIERYREEEEITRTITNFYSQRASGRPGINEAPIIALKNQLGYDEAYFNELIEQAKKKYKQGDTQGACEDLNLVKNLGSTKADALLKAYCK